MYDIIIIGLGPAGMTAGIFAARREMKTLVVGKELGGQLVWASEIENYPGTPKVLSFDLIESMRKQVVDSGAEIKQDEIKQIEKKDDGSFVVYTAHDSFETQSLVLAMGLSPRRLAIPGEVEFGGKGVSYCANCDGPFFKGKTVAVVGGGNSALDAAEVLSKIAKQVYLIHRNDSFKGFESLQEEIKDRENIEIMMESEIKLISGENKVESVIVLNKKDGSEKEIKLDGIFIEVGRIASTDLVADFVDRNDKNQIIIDNQGLTKTPGIFAAGDVTSCEVKQITVATGQATIAALSAYKYLQEKTGKKFVEKKY